MFLECDPGTYGVNCSEACGHCFANDQCDTVDGICSAGCNAGFEGPLCKDREYRSHIDPFLYRTIPGF